MLIPYQVRLDRAYSSELLRLGYIDDKQHNAIQNGLEELSRRHSAGELSVIGHEDVHSLVESQLNELYGADLVGNIHIGLSRNDQIVTLMRMWMKDKASVTGMDLTSLIRTIEQEIKTKGQSVFVGYTHHRIAMPTTYGELLKSYATGLTRDKKSLESWSELYDQCPLGTGAGYGTPIKLNRGRLAKELGFRRPAENSIDAVSTRWEPEVRLADTIKVMMNHLSVIAQDFIINSMEGINVISLPPEYCTGSSMMPQKLNPDVLETIKRKAIDVEGEAFKLSSVGRSNISGYNRDTQGAKYWIINIFQELSGSLDIVSEIIKGTKVNERRAKELLESGGAYTAMEVIKESIEKGKPYRSIKLQREREMKGHENNVS
ncbi:MAG: lyase family protein [Candidatus Aenigmatarchaeota archaeon]